MDRATKISMTAGAVAIGLAMLSQGASAQTTPRSVPRTVAALAEVCATPQSSPDYAAATFFCRGFLAGVGQYHAALHPAGARNLIRPIFCAPEPPPRLVDVAAAFVSWAQANPQYGNDAAVDGLMRFAQQTYPCPPQTTPPRRAGR